MNQMIKVGFFIFLISIIGLSGTKAQMKPHHQYALTPPMGWNSWNCFKRHISESQIKEIADLMASRGFLDAGYKYLVIDDGWAAGRDKNGVVYADSVKFPNGIKKLVEYVHSKGLKFGIYTSPGKTTCAGYVGSLGYEQKDVNTYAGWGVDFIKLDWCSGGDDERIAIAARWRKVLDNVKRPMVLSINFGQEAYNWASNYANMWRTTTDISACWDLPITETGGLPCSVLGVVDQQPGLERYQSPGSWNDPDMMQVGNGSLTESENRSHFSMWAILGAPLMMGNDLRKMTSEINALMINREVIAVNQDSSGYQGRKIFDSGEDVRRTGNNYGQEVWVKKLISPGEYAIVLLNRSDYKNYMKIDWSSLGLHTRGVAVRDLWKHQDLGVYDDYYAEMIAPHDVLFLKVKGAITKEITELFPQINDSIVTEAEKGLLGRSVKSSFYRGFSGNGYVQFNTEAQERYIRLVVNAPKEQMYLAGIRYCNVTGNPVKLHLNLDNKENELVCQTSVISGNAWDSKAEWKTTYIYLKLKQGLNVIKVSSFDVYVPLVDCLIVKPMNKQ